MALEAPSPLPLTPSPLSLTHKIYRGGPKEEPQGRKRAVVPRGVVSRLPPRPRDLVAVASV
ncbi:hypothetical protein E2C01_098992 [Portunus trituberculatus]|uniref:Uncharacterized protein n=1 Tax=Portunus trituberculatus TaxID=210409 RepID=A0A5B7KDP5_PORTR|nr:hypothetical protein [Portunus trituberculatus]